MTSKRSPIAGAIQTTSPQIELCLHTFTLTRNLEPALRHLRYDDRVRRILVQILLEHGASIDARNKEGLTPLVFAAYQDNEAVVNLLANKGADLKQKDNEGNGILHGAIMGSHEKIVGLLLAGGVDIESEGHDRWTVLHEAANSGDSTTLQHLLRYQSHFGGVMGQRDVAVVSSMWEL